MTRKTKIDKLKDRFNINAEEDEYVLALAGNPNVGKTSIFNSLTGLRQHTGNWPGKTVNNMQGRFTYKGKKFLLVDLPGTYSISAHSKEEEVARDFILFGKPDATIIVLDAGRLERNLNLALQVLEITSKVVVCVNLLDEAEKNGITINIDKLSKELCTPVIGCIAVDKTGISELKEALYQVSDINIKSIPRKINYSEKIKDAVAELMPYLEKIKDVTVNRNFLALRLLEGEQTFLNKVIQEVLEDER